MIEEVTRRIRAIRLAASPDRATAPTEELVRPRRRARGTLAPERQRPVGSSYLIRVLRELQARRNRE